VQSVLSAYGFGQSGEWMHLSSGFTRPQSPHTTQYFEKSAVGNGVGECSVGALVGAAVGAALGVAVGIAVGEALGVAVGNPVGLAEGMAVGLSVGEAVGTSVTTGIKQILNPDRTRDSSVRNEKVSLPVT